MLERALHDVSLAHLSDDPNPEDRAAGDGGRDLSSLAPSRVLLVRQVISAGLEGITYARKRVFGLFRWKQGDVAKVLLKLISEIARRRQRDENGGVDLAVLNRGQEGDRMSILIPKVQGRQWRPLP
jgi:hypothetical protein